MEDVILNVFKGDWGLASMDLDCLIQLSFSKFASAPVEFNFNGRPYLSPTGFLPYTSGFKLKSYEDFTDYLKKHNFDPNVRLEAEDKSLRLSYQHQIRSSLYPYYILTLFDNEHNFQVVRKMYGNRIGFPFSLYYPGKFEKIAKNLKEALFGVVTHEKDEHDAHQKAAIEARIFLNTISAKLGSKMFFFGDSPCEFDAHLYSYLAILYHIQLPNNPIQAHIAQCPNLVAYVKRITKRYFSEEAHDTHTVYDFSMYGKGSPDNVDGQEESKNRKFQIIATLFAVGMMVAFSISSGVFERGNFSRRLENISHIDDDEDDDDDE